MPATRNLRQTPGFTPRRVTLSTYPLAVDSLFLSEVRFRNLLGIGAAYRRCPSRGRLRAYAISGIFTAHASRPEPLVWVGSSREDLKLFPEEVRLVMGYALYLAQAGGKHPDTKPLRGFAGAGVLEVVDDFDGDTYRAV